MVKAKRERQFTKEIKKEPKEKAPKIITQIRQERSKEKNILPDDTKSRSRYMLWFIAAISAVFCLFALSFLFGKAEISVNPKTEDLVLNENLTAVKDSTNGPLSFDLVVIAGTANKTIQATAEKNVAIKATGTVLIFNTFSSSAQPLAVDTRLEGSNGKMYKTLTKTIVPGISKDGTPGQVEVGIYGSVAGEDYNSDTPLDFTIIGFKGTPKYSKIKVRSKPGTNITGGFVGLAPDITDADKSAAIADLNNTLKAKLLQKAAGQIPGGFILFKDAVFLSAGSADNEPNISFTNNKDNSMTLTDNGTLYGILFNEQKLTQKIAQDNIDKYDGADVYIPNIRGLTFSLSNKDNVSFNDLQNIDFNLSGPAKITWKLDTNKFTADLLGKPKKDFNQILSRYANIDSAVLKLSFPWMQSIPDKTKGIKVIVNYPE